MSEPSNLELVGKIYERWAEGAYGDDAWADPGIEFEIGDGPDAGTHQGREPMNAAFGEWLAAFTDFSVEPVDTQARGDRVLVQVRISGRGRSSGLPLATFDGYNLFVVRAGRVVRLELHLDANRARDRFAEA